ncbi:MAG: acetamidase/formamidase family protein [Propionibacteriaceae bacterium]|jgi:acetamidase/formamidase|nr:acetamidase/formamidase family protein [Propionibacteriaceae bacterium]
MRGFSLLSDTPTGVYLPSNPETITWGRLPCEADRPVLSVDPGQAITIDTVSHEGMLEDQGGDPLAYFTGQGIPADQVLPESIAIAAKVPHNPDDGPHIVTGPIEVRGAQPGDLLVVNVRELTPRAPYGVISNRHGRGALPGEYPRGPGNVSILAHAGDDDGQLTGTIKFGYSDAREMRFPLRPFLGIMGVAVAGPERPHSVPPGPHGGNLDIAMLQAGTSLMIPVQVPGALAYVGDPHYAQGDGEVAMTAFEAPLRAKLSFSLLRGADADQFGPVESPIGQVGQFLLPTGLDPDLGEALRKCVRNSISLLGSRFGVGPEHALAYLSAAVDFRISQVVDLVCGVHAVIDTSSLGT